MRNAKPGNHLKEWASLGRATHVPACTRYSALKNYYRQGIKLLSCIYRELPNFTRPLYKEFVNTAKKNLVCFLTSDTVRLSDSTPEKFNE